MLDPLLRLNTESFCIFPSVPPRHLAPSVSAPQHPPQPTSKCCWCPCKVPSLSPHPPNLNHWGLAFHKTLTQPAPVNPRGRGGQKDQGVSTSARRCGGWSVTQRYALQRVCVPAWAQGSAIQADPQFSSASKGLKHPGDSAADIPPAGSEPRPHLNKCRCVHLS